MTATDASQYERYYVIFPRSTTRLWLQLMRHSATVTMWYFRALLLDLDCNWCVTVRPLLCGISACYYLTLIATDASQYDCYHVVFARSTTWPWLQLMRHSTTVTMWYFRALLLDLDCNWCVTVRPLLCGISALYYLTLIATDASQCDRYYVVFPRATTWPWLQLMRHSATVTMWYSRVLLLDLDCNWCGTVRPLLCGISARYYLTLIATDASQCDRYYVVFLRAATWPWLQLMRHSTTVTMWYFRALLLDLDCNWYVTVRPLLCGISARYYLTLIANDASPYDRYYVIFPRSTTWPWLQLMRHSTTVTMWYFRACSYLTLIATDASQYERYYVVFPRASTWPWLQLMRHSTTVTMWYFRACSYLTLIATDASQYDRYYVVFPRASTWPWLQLMRHSTTVTMWYFRALLLDLDCNCCVTVRPLLCGISALYCLTLFPTDASQYDRYYVVFPRSTAWPCFQLMRHSTTVTMWYFRALLLDLDCNWCVTVRPLLCGIPACNYLTLTATDASQCVCY